MHSSRAYLLGVWPVCELCGVLLVAWLVGFFVCFLLLLLLRFIPLLQMLTEMNKGFYGLRPLNQAAVQAAGISISLKFR